MTVHREENVAAAPNRQPGLQVSRSRLRRGATVDTDSWSQAHTEERQRLRGRAVAEFARTEIVLAYCTGGAFHGLPLIGPVPDIAHTIPRSAHPPRSHGDVFRHEVPLPDEDVTLIDDVLVTTLDRTVFDMIRTLAPDAALACIDAAIRQVAWDDKRRTLDGVRAAAFTASIRRRIEDSAGARGIRQARVILELADGASQSPGESRSRWRMHDLAMPRPVLQLPVRTHLGEAYLDFAWPNLRRFGEFDGDVKFTDPEMARGRSREEVLADQATRRDAVEVITGWTGMHWGWPETANSGTFWASLLDQGWRTHWHG